MSGPGKALERLDAPHQLGPDRVQVNVADDDEFSTTPQASPERIVPGSIAEDDEFSTTPQASPQRIVPGADLEDDEFSTTPQAAPERVAPPASE